MADDLLASLGSRKPRSHAMRTLGYHEGGLTADSRARDVILSWVAVRFGLLAFPRPVFLWISPHPGS